MQELEIVREKIQNHYRAVKTDEDLEWLRDFICRMNDEPCGECSRRK